MNTLNDQLLEKLSIRLDSSDAYEIISYKQCPKLSYNTPGIAYTLVKIPEDPTQGCYLEFDQQTKPKLIFVLN